MYRYVCLSVYLLANLHKNVRTDLHEIFREGWQWANEQMIKFWWRPGSRITDPNTYPDTVSDPYRDTGKACLDGGMHYPSASSLYHRRNQTKFSTAPCRKKTRCLIFGHNLGNVNRFSKFITFRFIRKLCAYPL